MWYRRITFCRIGSVYVSCMAWKDVSSTLMTHLERCKTMTEIFSAPVWITQRKDKEMTCFFFNMGTRNYPVKSFVQDMYTTSTLYCSLNSEHEHPRPGINYQISCLQDLRSKQTILRNIRKLKVSSNVFDKRNGRVKRVLHYFLVNSHGLTCFCR